MTMNHSRVVETWRNLREYGLYNTSLRVTHHLSIHRVRNRLLRNLGFERCNNHTPLFLTWIQPADVDYMFTAEYVPKEGPEAVGGQARGTWDRHRIPFRDQLVFESLEQRYVHGYDWEETNMLDEALMTGGQVNWLGKWEEKDAQDLRNKCEKFDKIAESIQRHGYVSQLELYESQNGEKIDYQKRLGNLLVPDELCIAIGRNGEIIRMANAKHRLAIATVLEIDDRIPAIVQLRHTEWNGELDAPVEPLSEDYPLVEVKPM